MTGHAIAVESQQETSRAYTRVFAFLFLFTMYPVNERVDENFDVKVFRSV